MHNHLLSLWLIWWYSKVDNRLNDFLQTWHVCVLVARWLRWCDKKSHNWLNCDWHRLHLYSFSPRQDFWWASKTESSVNAFLQFLHSKDFPEFKSWETAKTSSLIISFLGLSHPYIWSLATDIGPDGGPLALLISCKSITLPTWSIPLGSLPVRGRPFSATGGCVKLTDHIACGSCTICFLWWVNTLDWSNHSLQSSQWYNSPLVCFFLCVDKWDECLKVFSQTLHLYGRSFVWTLWWAKSPDDWLKDFSQFWHWYRRSFLWDFLWLDKWDECLKVLSQESHLYGLAPVWTRRWAASPDDWLNDLSQSWQW